MVRMIYIKKVIIVFVSFAAVCGCNASRSTDNKMTHNLESKIYSAVEHKVLERDGYGIHYYISGSNNADVILFLHPAFSDHRAFDQQVDFFSGKYKVITIDLLGHGLSKANKSKDKIDSSAKHINEIVETEECKKIHLVGVSMGTLVAQYFALNYPDKVKSLTALGGYDINKNNEELAKTQRKSNMGLILKALFSMVAFRKQTAKISTHTAEGELQFYNSASLYERKSFMVMQGLQNIIKDRDVAELIYPTLILTGEYDIELAKQMAEEWHSTINRSEYSMIEDAGHCANMDKAVKFNQIVGDFIEDNN